MKGRSSESLNLIAQLDNISSSLQTIFKKHEFDEDLTLDKIKSIFLGKNKVKTTFVEFYDKYLEDIKAQVGAGKSIALYHKYSAARKHFVNFLHTKYGRKDLMPGELTHLIIHDFEIYLRTVVALKPNSATKTLKFFKTVVIFAQKCGVMTHDPFLNHHFILNTWIEASSQMTRYGGLWKEILIFPVLKRSRIYLSFNRTRRNQFVIPL